MNSRATSQQIDRNNLVPIKSVVISGNLLDGISYKLCPITEFSEGVWNLTLSSLGYYCNIPDIDNICSVSCNLVTAQKYNSNNEVELYEQPFGIFILKQGPKKTFTFEKTWFYINSLSSELNVTVKNEQNQQKLRINCDFYIQLLFRRVK